MYPQNSNRIYYPAIDVLRGLAISIVVIYHIFDFISFFRFGWMGVDLFFVMSGFLITDLLLKSRENNYYFRNFYLRRILRIFPIYYLTLIVFFILSPLLFSQKGPFSTYSYYNENKFWYWSYLQNWLMVKKGPAPVPFLSHFWSLAIEEQFYIFWPILIYLIKNIITLKKIIYGLIIIAIIFRIYIWVLKPNEVEVFYCNTLTRMDSILMGCFLGVHLKQGKEISSRVLKIVVLSFVSLITISMVTYGNVRQDNLLFPTVGYSISAAFFTSLLYLLIKNKEYFLPNALHLKALKFIGKISYGMYVYHIPIYFILSYIISRILNNYNITSFNVGLIISSVSLLATIIASSISFYYIEKPLLSLKKYLP